MLFAIPIGVGTANRQPPPVVLFPDISLWRMLADEIVDFLGEVWAAIKRGGRAGRAHQAVTTRRIT